MGEQSSSKALNTRFLFNEIIFIRISSLNINQQTIGLLFPRLSRKIHCTYKKKTYITKVFLRSCIFKQLKLLCLAQRLKFVKEISNC